MSFFYWGKKNAPKQPDPYEGWTRRMLPVNQIQYGNIWLFGSGPDKRGRDKLGKWADEPIEVVRVWGGGYRVRDGNDRLHYAREDGKTHIDCWVRD